MDSKKKKSGQISADSEDYLSDIQAGQYQNNTRFINDQILIKAGETNEKATVIFINAAKILSNPSSESQQQQQQSSSKKKKQEVKTLRRYFIYFMDEIVNSQYIMVFFNTGVSSYSPMQSMFSILKNLPNKYFMNLSRFYIVSPSFYVKSYNFFNTPTQVKPKLEYLKTLREFNRVSFFKAEFLNAIPDCVKIASRREEENSGNATSSTTSRSESNGSRNGSNSPPLKEHRTGAKKVGKLFGLSLCDLEVCENTAAEKAGFQLPKVIAEFIAYFTQSEIHIQEQGIFRKAPRTSEIQEMEEKLIAKDYAFLQQHEDPHVVATSFKKLLSELPEPIFPYNQYELIKLLSTIPDIKERKAHVKQLVLMMPQLNQNVLKCVIELLRIITQYSESNLMKSEALTKIFAPTLLRVPPKSEKMEQALEELMMNPTFVEILSILFCDYNTIFAHLLPIAAVHEHQSKFQNYSLSQEPIIPTSNDQSQQNNNQEKGQGALEAEDAEANRMSTCIFSSIIKDFHSNDIVKVNSMTSFAEKNRMSNHSNADNNNINNDKDVNKIIFTSDFNESTGIGQSLSEDVTNTTTDRGNYRAPTNLNSSNLLGTLILEPIVENTQNSNSNQSDTPSLNNNPPV